MKKYIKILESVKISLNHVLSVLNPDEKTNESIRGAIVALEKALSEISNAQTLLIFDGPEAQKEELVKD